MTPEQLKASILQRAMEGKLVPQDPNDEPASELLKRIKAEKEKLIKEGKIKRDKNETEIFRGDDGLHYEKFQDGSIKQVDVPFEIPESWEWVNLGQVGTLQRGSGIKKSETVSKGIQCVRYGEIYTTYDYFFTETVSSTTSEVAKRSLAVNADDILITLTGENKKDIGKAVAYLGNAPCVMGGDLSKLSNHKMNAKYLSFILNSPNVNAQKSALATGNIIVHISNSKLEKILVPTPPIKEQQEIVDTVEYYFSFVDEYKIAQNILKKINDEFPEKLRKSIMQYAMQGKLVPQDATDEPVEVLLEKIREEKQKLLTEGKLKKKDLQEAIIYQGDDNSYYEKNGSNAFLIEAELDPLQNGWCYKCLSDLIRVNTGLSYKKENLSFEQEGVRILRGGNISPLHLKLLSTDYFINKKYVSNPDLYLQKNQILTPVSTSLQHIGKFARVNETYEDVVAGGFVFQLTPFMLNDIFSQFMEYALSSHQIYKQLINITNLSGQALYNIPKSKLMKIIIALPSLDEQERINSKLKLVFSNVQDLEKFL